MVHTYQKSTLYTYMYIFFTLLITETSHLFATIYPQLSYTHFHNSLQQQVDQEVREHTK